MSRQTLQTINRGKEWKRQKEKANKSSSLRKITRETARSPEVQWTPQDGRTRLLEFIVWRRLFPQFTSRSLLGKQKYFETVWSASQVCLQQILTCFTILAKLLCPLFWSKGISCPHVVAEAAPMLTPSTLQTSPQADPALHSPKGNFLNLSLMYLLYYTDDMFYY